ncbi:hypothetical protein chiPu_0032207, partial [Chiloscyllium punctatum]|nr:hypothetical protein [Chiloscyllium punctatum]
ELRHAVSCKKTSRWRRRRRPARPGGVPLSKQLRAARELRLSNGRLYPGPTGSLGLEPSLGPGLGPGPQRLLDDLGPGPGLGRGCSHIRICQECRRIQGLRTTRLPPSRGPVQAEEQPPVSGPQPEAGNQD